MQDLELLVPEFEYYEKDIKWYVYFGIIMGIIVLISIFNRNFTLIAIVLLSAILIVIRAGRKPNLIKLIISGDGISLGNEFWEYKDIKSFSLFEADGKKYLIFIPIGKFRLQVKVPVSDPEAIRQRLNNLVSEVEYEESLIEILGRISKI